MSLRLPTILECCVQELAVLHYSAVDFTKTAMSMATSPGTSGIIMIGEVADYLKVPERTIHRLAAARKISAFKVGGSWRFSRADIDI